MHRHITTLLEDVVFFVIGKESTGGLQRPNPLTEEGVIIRERQKLLREQYVLKEIFNLLSIPIKHGGENELSTVLTLSHGTTMCSHTCNNYDVCLYL